jgi:hypothetical protein
LLNRANPVRRSSWQPSRRSVEQTRKAAGSARRLRPGRFLAGWGGLIITLCLSPASGQEPSRAILVDGRQVPAVLRSIESQETLRFQVEDQDRTWDASDLVAWGEFRDLDHGCWTVLAGGSILAGELIAASRREVRIDPRSFLPFTSPKARLRGIVWRPAADPIERDRLFRELAWSPRDADRLWLANGDELQGQFAGLQVDASGSAGVLSENVRFMPRSSREEVAVPLEDVRALGLAAAAPASPARPPAADRENWLLLGLRDGSRLFASSILLADGQVHLALREGPVLIADATDFWPRITAIQPAARRFTYLSDLPHAGYRHIPFLATAWSYGIDRNVLGGNLRSAGAIYPKGIGMHTTSRLAYPLNQAYRTFRAEIALDEAAGWRGSVLFRILVDRLPPGGTSNQWQMAYVSPIVRGGEPPLPIEVDVAGADRMALVVEFAERGDQGDHANWLNARLIP